MTVVSLGKRAAAAAGFYVPQFAVKIAGVGLPRDVARDVVDVSYHDSLKELDGFELTVNNWDAERAVFKYIGGEPEDRPIAQAPDADRQRYQLFEPSDRPVELWVGYGDETRLLMTGTFTALEPEFPAAGRPVLKVRGLNVLHRLRIAQHTTTWRHKTDSAIARDLAGRTDRRTGKPRFPLPIHINSNAAHGEPELELVTQQNQYDIDFLFARARERDYDIVVREADEVRGQPRHLYFGPSGRPPSVFHLHWGATLVEFTPSLNTAKQVESVTVSGWSRATKSKIEETVTLDDASLTTNRDLLRLFRPEHREEVRVREPVFTRQEARARARAILADRLKDLVTVTATTVGLPDLRAGQYVRITGVGRRFGGLYFVQETTHTVNESGYRVRFTARRENSGGGGDR